MVIEIDLFENEDEDVIVASDKQKESQETENNEEIDYRDRKNLQLQSIYDFPKKSLNIPIFYTSK